MDTAPPHPAPQVHPQRVQRLVQALGEGLLERDAAVRLALLAALAGEHVLLLGPPGTAKSALARRLHAALADVRWFERLLTRFSTPEELFGPLSLKALEDDRYERLVDGFLPTAGVAFLDEVFKANSAILNALLTLLNERAFDNGTARLGVPLVAVVAASNEVPADDALQAFYDRFLVRVPVAPVGDAAFAALLALPDATPALGEPPLSAAERAAIAAATGAVVLGDGFVGGLAALRAWLARRGAPLSDRRWRQWVKLARTAAAAEGRATLDAFDLWTAPYVAAATPEDAPALAAWYSDEWLALPPTQAPWLERAVQAFEAQLQVEQRAPTEEGDDAAGKLALARAIGLGQGSGEVGSEGTGNDSGMTRLVSERLQAQLRRRYSAVHVAARVAQVAEVEARLAAERDALQAALQAQRTALACRLWMPPPLVAALHARHEAALALLDGLAARLATTREGFASHPLREGLDAAEAAPAPVVLDAA